MTDLLAYDDVAPDAVETDDPLEELEQDTFHVLTEDPGANPDDPTRGLNLPAMLSGILDRGLEQAAETEAQKDQRVAFARARLTTTSKDQEGVQAVLEVELQPDDATLGTSDRPLKVTILAGSAST